jgi:hypothetical protein
MYDHNIDINLKTLDTPLWTLTSLHCPHFEASTHYMHDGNYKCYIALIV